MIDRGRRFLCGYSTLNDPATTLLLHTASSGKCVRIKLGEVSYTDVISGFVPASARTLFVLALGRREKSETRLESGAC